MYLVASGLLTNYSESYSIIPFKAKPQDKPPSVKTDPFKGQQDKIMKKHPKGPCTQVANTLALKYPAIGTLGPKYILFGYMASCTSPKH